MIINRKKLLALTISVLTAASIYAASFSATTGIKGDLYSNSASDNLDPVMTLSGFFAGQLDLNPNTIIRSELSIETTDIIENGLFEDTDAKFRIDELSFTYVMPFLNTTQYMSLFIGTFEPIGTDLFLRRQFGVLPITSMLTENWMGLKGIAIFPYYGIGGAWTINFNTRPFAAGVSIYKNKNNSEDVKQLNVDFRFATATNLLTVDAQAGFGAPLDSKNGSEDVILLIDELYLHTGIDFLLGNKYSQALFIEAGFDNMPLKAGESKNEISSDDIFLLVEPRLYTNKFRANLTFFSLPKQAVEKLIYIDDNQTLGLDLTIYTDQLYIKNKDFTFGFHTTLSFPDRDFFDLKRYKDLIEDDYVIKVSPFVNAPVMGGDLKFMLQAKINGFSTNKWQDQFKINIGYKTTL